VKDNVPLSCTEGPDPELTVFQEAPCVHPWLVRLYRCSILRTLGRSVTSRPGSGIPVKSRTLSVIMFGVTAPVAASYEQKKGWQRGW
jgi:hypothetical protein